MIIKRSIETFHSSQGDIQAINRTRKSHLLGKSYLTKQNSLFKFNRQHVRQHNHCVLFNYGKDVCFVHDQKFAAINVDFSTGIAGKQDTITLGHLQ